MNRTILFTLASAIGLASASLPLAVSASPPICTYYSPDQWMKKEAVETKARAMGHTTFYVQPEGGCWGIYTGRNGRNWRILLDPATGEIVREGQT